MGGVLAGHDTLSHDYPATWWGWTQVRAFGSLPLWNPSWFCGQAFLASQTFMPFYPPNWLSGLLPFPLAFNIQYPLHLALAAALMAWVCRRRGLGWAAAGLAGLAWGMGGHLATLTGAGHLQKLQALAWLPPVVLGARWLAAGLGWRAVALFGGALAMQVTAGHMQVVWLTLLASAAEVAGQTARGIFRRGGLSFATAATGLRRAGLGAAGLAVGLGLAAIFLVPTLEFARLSNRQGSLPWEEATSSSLPSEEAFEFAVPRLLGDSMPHGRGAYLGRFGAEAAPERIVSDYVGAGVLLFALFGLLMGGKRRGTVVFYLLLTCSGLVLSLGRFAPFDFYHKALRLLPGLSHFRSPATSMALLAYGLVMAAAHGLDTFFRPPAGSPERVQRRHRAAGSLMLLACVPAAVLLFQAKASLVRLEPVTHDPSDPLRMAEAVGLALRAAAWGHLARGVVLTAFFAGLWAWLKGMPAGLRGREPVAAACLLALVAGWSYDLLANDRPFWNAVDGGPYHSWLINHWALSTWKHDVEFEQLPCRYLEYGNELSNRALTLSDFSRYFLVASGHGYHPVTYGRYSAILKQLGFYHPAFLRLFAINYLIWPRGSEQRPPEGFTKEKDEPKWILLHDPTSYYVHEIRNLQMVEDGRELLARLADPRFNPLECTLVLRGDLDKDIRSKDDRLRDFSEPAHLEAHVFPKQPGRTLIRCSTVRETSIVVSEPAAPGWRAWVNWSAPEGKPLSKSARVTTVNGFCLAIGVPAGRSEVDLFYDPASQRFGVFLTMLALAVLAAAAGANLRRASARKHAKKNDSPIVLEHS